MSITTRNEWLAHAYYEAARHLSDEQIKQVESGGPLDSAQMQYARACYLRLMAETADECPQAPIDASVTVTDLQME